MIVQWTLAGTVVGAAAMLGRGIFAPRSALFGQNISHGPRGRNRIAITFDDGPHADFTPAVLEILDRLSVKATFFVIGAHAEQHPELLGKMHQAGHLIGNHSFHHDRLGAFRPVKWWLNELRRSNQVIVDTIDRNPRLFRPPIGIKSPRICRALRQEGMLMVTWTRRGRDGWSTTADAIVSRIVPRTTAGDIILLHDGVEQGRARDPQPMLKALPGIIASLRERGFNFVRVDELISIDGYRSEA